MCNAQNATQIRKFEGSYIDVQKDLLALVLNSR